MSRLDCVGHLPWAHDTHTTSTHYSHDSAPPNTWSDGYGPDRGPLLPHGAAAPAAISTTAARANATLEDGPIQAATTPSTEETYRQ